MSQDDPLEIHGRKTWGLRCLCISCCSHLLLQTGCGLTDVTRRQHRETTPALDKHNPGHAAGLEGLIASGTTRASQSVCAGVGR